MATTVNSYPNAKVNGNPLSADEVNTLSDGSELHHVNLCELFGTGVIGSADWNLGIVAGQIALTITAGQGIVGDAGERKVCATTSSVTITSTQGLGASNTYYVFKKRDLGTVGDDATGFVAQLSSTAPADSILIGSAVLNASEATSVNNWPSGRVNLDTVGTAWHTPNTFTFVVDCPPGEDRIADVNFASQGSYAGEYFIRATHDQDSDKTVISEAVSGRTGSRFRLIVQNASDASAGTYGTSTQIQVTMRLEGRLWTPNASPTAPTVTVSEFAGGAEEFVGVLFTGTQEVSLASSVAETTILGTGDGSLSLAANFWTAGKTIRFRVAGRISNTATPTLQIKVKLDSTLILDTGAITTPGSLLNSLLLIEGEITCYTAGASGTVIGWMRGTIGATPFGVALTGVVIVDTTQADAFNVTAQWGTSSASNTLTQTNTTLEALS